MNFHDVRFPTAIALGSTGGPERRTDIVILGSGYEERNARWADSRRTYNAGYGIKTLDDLHAVIDFFEERRGQLYGFRWRDPTDWKSCPPQATPTNTDQLIGT
ncbi:MAG: TIGR02217 family protein, partial [Pseudomonadota bacterium]